MITVERLNAIPGRPAWLREWRKLEEKTGHRLLQCRHPNELMKIEVWPDKYETWVSLEEQTIERSSELVTYGRLIDRLVTIEHRLHDFGLTDHEITIPLRELFHRMAAKGRLLAVPDLFKNAAGEQAANWRAMNGWWVSLHRGTDGTIRVFTEYSDGVCTELKEFPIDNELIDLGMAPLL